MCHCDIYSFLIQQPVMMYYFFLNVLKKFRSQKHDTFLLMRYLLSNTSRSRGATHLPRSFPSDFSRRGMVRVSLFNTPLQRCSLFLHWLSKHKETNSKPALSPPWQVSSFIGISIWNLSLNSNDVTWIYLRVFSVQEHDVMFYNFP